MSSADLHHLLRTRVLGALRSIPTKYKVLVVDGTSLKLLNSILTLAALGEEGVLMVEDVGTRPRSSQPTRDVLYLVTATEASLNGVMEDWRTPNPPFAAAHILTTNGGGVGVVWVRARGRAWQSLSIRHILLTSSFTHTNSYAHTHIHPPSQPSQPSTTTSWSG
jgi:hypothetical protein